MGKVAERIYDRVADNLNTERQSVLERLEQSSMRYNQLNNEGQWVSKVQSLVVDIDHLQTFNKREKRDWLSRIVDRIDVRYLHDAKEHEVSVAMKVPLFTDDELGIMVTPGMDELPYRYGTFHSTVVGLPSFGVVSGENCTNTFVKATIKVRSPGCWVSTYTDYQQFLSDKIISCR